MPVLWDIWRLCIGNCQWRTMGLEMASAMAALMVAESGGCGLGLGIMGVATGHATAGIPHTGAPIM